MRRMQQDQAKLQGKAATSGRRKPGGDEVGQLQPLRSKGANHAWLC